MKKEQIKESREVPDEARLLVAKIRSWIVGQDVSRHEFDAEQAVSLIHEYAKRRQIGRGTHWSELEPESRRVAERIKSVPADEVPFHIESALESAYWGGYGDRDSEAEPSTTPTGVSLQVDKERFDV